MKDINAEAEKTLSKLECRVQYYYPESFNDFPIVSFYNLAERPEFSSDNHEDIQNGTVVVDIWSDRKRECGDISLEVNEVMTADGWVREFSRDIPPEGRVYHKTMRFSKSFLV